MAAFNFRDRALGGALSNGADQVERFRHARETILNVSPEFGVVNVRHNENARLTLGPSKWTIGLGRPAKSVDVDLMAQRAGVWEVGELGHEQARGEDLVIARRAVAVLDPLGGPPGPDLGGAVAGSGDAYRARQLPGCAAEDLAHLAAVFGNGELEVLDPLLESLNLFQQGGFCWLGRQGRLGGCVGQHRCSIGADLWPVIDRSHRRFPPLPREKPLAASVAPSQRIMAAWPPRRQPPTTGPP